MENRLLQHEDIKEAAVTAREDEGEKYICAYVVSDKDIATLDLRGYLKKSLPEYMIPSYFMKLEKMPLTANGKLNRKSLPKPEIEINLNEYEEPRNETEEKLVKIWKEVLGAEKVGINDNFFELGGHSLKASILSNRIYKELNIDIPIGEIYNRPTVKEICELIQKNEELSLRSMNIDLKNKFSKPSMIVKYDTELTEEIVLHTDEDIEKVLDYIKNNSKESIDIDYITDYSSLEEGPIIQKINTDKLSKKLKLKKIEENKIDRILKELKADSDELRENIFLKKRVYKYDMGCVANENAKLWDRKIKRSKIRFIIPFKNKNFQDNKNAILLKLINEQPVLRSSICFEEGLYKFAEYEKLDNINFNIIDLSEYDYKSKIEAMERIMDFMEKALNEEGGLNNILYYFAIIKLSLNQYCFLLNIAHLISDINAKRIIRMYLEERCDKNYEILPFSHYINNILLCDKEKKFEIFNKSLILKEYKAAADLFYKKYPCYTTGSPIRFSEPFVIKYNSDFKPILETAIYIVSKILYIQFEIDSIPLGILSNKRIWEKYKYYNTIGNFVDKIPCTFNGVSHKNSKFDYYKKYLETDAELSKDNIVLKELNGDIEFTKYIYILSPFSLNYLGDYTPFEDEQYLKGIRRTFIQSYPVNSYSVGGSELRIIFINGVEKDRLPSIEKFMEELGGTYEWRYI
nr:phosphopantetheine-binding protein [Acidilutibacter cellobiosedens]